MAAARRARIAAMNLRMMVAVTNSTACAKMLVNIG